MYSILFSLDNTNKDDKPFNWASPSNHFFFFCSPKIVINAFVSYIHDGGNFNFDVS